MAMLSLSAQRPPGPRKLFPGQMLLWLRRGIIPFLTGLARDYGDVAYYASGGKEMLLLSHPDLVKTVLVDNAVNVVKGHGLEKAKQLFGEGLLTSEGAYHDSQRRLIQPAFHRLRVTPYGVHMAQRAEAAAQRWQPGKPIDIQQEMIRLTMSIAGYTLFSADIAEEAAEIGEAFTTAIELFDRVMSPLAGLEELLPFHKRRFQLARARLDDTILRIIRERRAAAKDRGDLLSRMLGSGEPSSGQKTMPDEQLRDECMTLFLAGHETLATALTWAWYLLAQNPQAADRVRAEVASLQATDSLTAEHLPRLRYTEMVIAEAMRLYPPVWMLDRRVVKPFELAGYQIPVGTILVMCPFVVQRDARFYPDPLRFDPERWTAGERASRPHFAYFPFGAGPRQCLGEAFAWMEATLIMASIARNWRLELAPGAQVELAPTVTLRPKRGIPMIPFALARS
jgi:cytochrome P450